MLIRPAKIDDAEGIAAAHVTSWRETYAGIVPDNHLRNLSIPERTARWQATLSEMAADRGLLVAEQEGQIIGFCSFGSARAPEIGLSGEIYALYLLQAAQGQGWGRKLFEAAQNSLKSMGMAGCYLWVLKANKTAGFYRHLGGVECGAKTITIGGADLEEIALCWKEEK